jgi:hypothetical protein
MLRSRGRKSSLETFPPAATAARGGWTQPNQPFARRAAAQKAAACFARRVNRASQKYSAFRMTEIMI